MSATRSSIVSICLLGALLFNTLVGYAQETAGENQQTHVYLPLISDQGTDAVDESSDEVVAIPVDNATEATVMAAAATTTLRPTAYTTTQGSSGGQPVTNLYTQDQSRIQNDWNKYVEFLTPNVIYSGYRTYLLPTTISLAAITALQVKANFLGPTKSYQTWTWAIFNWSNNSWTNLGDNASAPSWQWTLLSFNASGTLANYVNSTTRQIRVRVQSNSAIDDMDLDYEAILVSDNSQSTSLIQKVAIPSYFEPGSIWTQLESGAPTVGLAIINPSDGVGTTISQTYVSQTSNTKSKGVIVLGYVFTNYGQRLAAEVKAEIDKYYQWYGVQGIFLDEASTDCNQLAYYQALYSYVKAKGGVAKVVVNPGTNTNECYMAATDIVINFEDTYTRYLSWQPSGWETKYAADRFWHLVIETPQANMPNAISLSKSRRAGWVYVTPDTLANNPWDSLPPTAYWTDELYRASH